jgi:hypothetical protein
MNFVISFLFPQKIYIGTQEAEGHEFEVDVVIWQDTCFKNPEQVGHWQLMPVILATQEAEIRRIAVW